MKEKHKKFIKCRKCDETFDETFQLENHMKEHEVQTFKCEVCEKSFYIKWRLEKHKTMHQQSDVKFCHYFNNEKLCPFEEIGCMFRHAKAEPCKFKNSCKSYLCQFQHPQEVNDDTLNEEEVQSNENSSGKFKCEFICEVENDLDDHLNDIHEEWKVTEMFCDKFCRGDHGIHIC